MRDRPLGLSLELWFVEGSSAARCGCSATPTSARPAVGEELPGVADDGGAADPAVQLGERGTRALVKMRSRSAAGTDAAGPMVAAPHRRMSMLPEEKWAG